MAPGWRTGWVVTGAFLHPTEVAARREMFVNFDT
jgi:hypothetical protein